MPITQAQFEFVRKFIKENAAIVLDAGKEYLVETRLMPVAQQEGMQDLSALIVALGNKANPRLQSRVIEAMTTNETSFFRDFHPFETLKKEILPPIIKAREATKELRIWCAATSSGQEPYSLSMLLKESFPQLANWHVRIVCTDISEEMLERTRMGVYSQLEVNRGLPVALLMKYFKQDGTKFHISDELKKPLELRTINLAGMWPNIGQMDLVLIRNVLIYFDLETKRGILQKIRNVLKDDGYLFLGATETTINIDDTFEVMHLAKTSCYKKKLTNK